MGSNQGCLFSNIDFGFVKTLDFDFFVHVRDYDNDSIGIAQSAQEKLGKKILWINTKNDDLEGECYQNDFEINKSKCSAKSVIDVVRRLEELSEFLGVDTTDSIKQ